MMILDDFPNFPRVVESKCQHFPKVCFGTEDGSTVMYWHHTGYIYTDFCIHIYIYICV